MRSSRRWDEFTLCVNYFCSLLGPTWPNRFYLAAGTSGGITTSGVWGYGVFDYSIILDLLDDAGVTWKVYNIGWDSVPFGNTDNVFVFWKRWAHDQRTRGSKGDYLNDLRLGRLPQVSFIVPSFARGWDEHPPADVSVGMGIQSVNHRFDVSSPRGPNNEAAGGQPTGPPAPPRDALADPVRVSRRRRVAAGPARRAARRTRPDAGPAWSPSRSRPGSHTHRPRR